MIDDAVDDEEFYFSTESDLLDGERWSDEETESVPVGQPELKSPHPVTAKVTTPTTFQKPNFAGVRKYIAEVMKDLQLEYPHSSDKELRSMATTRWHGLTEPERIGTV